MPPAFNPSTSLGFLLKPVALSTALANGLNKLNFPRGDLIALAEPVLAAAFARLESACNLFSLASDCVILRLAAASPIPLFDAAGFLGVTPIAPGDIPERRPLIAPGDIPVGFLAVGFAGFGFGVTVGVFGPLRVLPCCLLR